MSYLHLLQLAAPEAILVLTALILLGVGLTSLRPTSPLFCTVAAVGLVAAAVSLFFLPAHANLSGGMLVISPLNTLFQAICLALAFLAVLLTESERSLPHRAEYLAVLLFATVGLLLLVGSEEFLMIFIGLELLGLSLYVLTGWEKSEPRAAEAGLKYFLFGSTASAFTLFGLSLIYGVTGSTMLTGISAGLNAGAVEPIVLAGIVMTLVGFAFKIAAAPFHLWAPDAYEAAPIPSAAFIASGSKLASFVVLGKVLLVGFAPLAGSAAWHAMVAGWAPLVAVLAAFSILLGNLVALAQTNVRRLLAYSAVAHAGYTLLGLVAGGREGFTATLFYTVIYALTLIGAFGVCGVVRHETGADDVRDFRGLRARSPMLAAAMAIFLLSLAGLPPLAGFFGKFYLFRAAFHAGTNNGLTWLVVLALFGSLLSLYYYLVVLKAIFVDETAETATAFHPEFLNQCVVGLLALLVLFFGLMPQTLVQSITTAL
ncbi:MAG: NADH-quinone oxidoreductase subunit N [Verrucomicrobiota bacterium]